MSKEKTGKDFGLNNRQSKFCKFYTTSKELFANGVLSYIEAYSTKKKSVGYDTAKVNASKLLTNTNILEYIDYLLGSNNLNDGYVDRQLGFLITQNVDLRLKLAAIKEYNHVRQRTKKTEEEISLPRPIMSIDIKRPEVVEK